MSKLLLDEKPILVLPSLAEKIGLNEAIILQQLNYWIQISKHEHEGRKWVYNTYEDWQMQFPFWSISTIRRAISKLEKEGLLIAGNFNRSHIDKTKWYSIDFEVLEGLNSPSVQNEQSIDHNEQSSCSERADELVNLNKAIPESTSESSSDIKKEVKEDAPAGHMKLNPFEFFQENGFGSIGGHIAEKITAWCEDLSDELVIYAMEIAVESGQCKWSYVNAILVNWVQRKLTTVEQVKAARLAFKQQSSRAKASPRRSGSIRQEKLPTWFEQPEENRSLIVEEDGFDFEAEKAKLEAELKKE
jgi:DnaD/phage-associated family protein